MGYERHRAVLVRVSLLLSHRDVFWARRASILREEEEEEVTGLRPQSHLCDAIDPYAKRNKKTKTTPVDVEGFFVSSSFDHILDWTFAHSFIACLTPRSIMISSDPPGMAYALTSR